MSAFASAGTLDIPFARKVLEHLRAHPEEHRQHDFGIQTPCGTKACIAGPAVMMSATGQFTFHPEGWMTDLAGTTHGIQEQATQLLGLAKADAHKLFFEFDNSTALTRLGNYIAKAEETQR